METDQTGQDTVESVQYDAQDSEDIYSGQTEWPSLSEAFASFDTAVADGVAQLEASGQEALSALIEAGIV